MSSITHTLVLLVLKVHITSSITHTLVLLVLKVHITCTITHTLVLLVLKVNITSITTHTLVLLVLKVRIISIVTCALVHRDITIMVDGIKHQVTYLQLHTLVLPCSESPHHLYYNTYQYFWLNNTSGSESTHQLLYRVRTEKSI